MPVIDVTHPPVKQKIGLSRNHETLRPENYFEKFVGHLEARTAIIIDPMLATAGSMIATIDLLKACGCRDVRCWTAAVDGHFDAAGSVIPGLGDAGDKIFGTKES